MAKAGEGETSYRGGAGGKFKKQPARRNQKTPYDRPPSIVSNPRPGGWVSKLFDPASKFISARAFKFFSNFRKRLTEGEQETREIAQEAPPSLVDCNEAIVQGPTCNGHIANSSGGFGISDLEKMLQQKTFTRNEIDRLTELLHSRTMESSLRDEEKTSEGNLFKPVPDYRKGSLLQENKDDSNIFQGNVPATGGNSRVLEDDIASPAELAKAYMGRTYKVSPSMLGVRTQTIKEDTPKSSALSLLSKSVLHDGVPEKGLTTPRSRGRSAIYNMARTPYTRGTASTKYIYGGGSSSPQSAWEHNGQYGSKQLALKRRSSVLDDDSRSVGAMRRIRQKPNLSYHASPLSANVTDFGYSSGQNHASTDKPLLVDAGKTKVSKNCEESEDNSIAGSSYPLVHSQSRQMASKILQQLEKFTPQKSSESKLINAKDKSPIKLTSNMLHGQALRSLENADSAKFLQKQDGKRSEDCCNASPDAGGDTSQEKNNGENGFKNMGTPLKLTPSSAGTNARVSMTNAVPNIKSGKSIVSEFAVQPPNKRAFHMTANEDFQELEDEIQTNGFVSVSSGGRREGLQTFRDSVSPRVIAEEKISEGKIHENLASSSTNDLKISDGFMASNKNIGAQMFSVGAPISNTPPAIHGQTTSVVNNSGPSREPSLSGVRSKIVDTPPPFTFSSSSPCESTGPNLTSSFDSRRQSPRSFGSDAQLNTRQSDGGETKNTDRFEHLTQSSEKSTAAAAAAVSASSASGFVSSILSADNPVSNNGLVDSSPFSQLIAPKLPLSNSTEQVGISSTIVHTPASVAVTSGSTNGSSIFAQTPSFPEALPTPSLSVPSQSVAAPIFSFGLSKTESSPSATVSTTSGVGITEIKSNDVEDTLKLPSSGTLFGGTNAANNTFGFSSSLAASSSSNQAQVSPSGFGNLSAASSLLAPTTGVSTVAQSAPFQFGSSGSSTIFGTSGTSFNANSTVASSSAPSNPFGSGTTPSTAPASPFTITPNSSSAVISNAFSYSWQTQTNKAPVMGSVASSPSPSTLFPFGASNTASATSTFSFTSPTATSSALPALSQSQPVFGSSTALRATGNSGDQMNMEDSMTEDPVHSSNPSVSVFGQPLVPPSNPTVPVFVQPLSSSSNPTVPAFGQSLVSPSPPGFMFGSTAPQSVSPFHFGGQQNQAAPPIPSFQASNSGGSFSLGSGGGDKGSRKMVRISKNRNRKK